MDKAWRPGPLPSDSDLDSVSLASTLSLEDEWPEWPETSGRKIQHGVTRVDSGEASTIDGDDESMEDDDESSDSDINQEDEEDVNPKSLRMDDASVNPKSLSMPVETQPG